MGSSTIPESEFDLTGSTIPKFEFDLTGRSETRVLPIASEIVPWVTTSKAWKQYTNDYIYNADKLMRDWLRIMNKNGTWYRNYKLRRYQFKQLFEILMGEPYNQKKHSKWVIPMTRIFAYYSSRIDDHHWDSKKQKTVSTTCYVISGQRIKQPAYSLRLRLEEFSSQGIIPTATNMKLPKDDLKKGEARRTETRNNKKRRQEEWKRRQKN